MSEKPNGAESIVPIASLDPTVAPDSDLCIGGVVILVWPFSSSSQSTALLIAESDFRLRRRKGQIRIRFDGSAAKHVATSRIGIGDQVTLSLKGSEWDTNSVVSSTPGRSVEGELVYRNSLSLRVSSASRE